jgi:hypothetical protein
VPIVILALVIFFVALSQAQNLEPKLIQWGHTATLLLDGRVLLAGGTCGLGVQNCGREAQVYDPKSGEFSLVGPMLTSRWQHAATLLADGRVLITGGAGGKPGAPLAEIFDPRSNTFLPTGDLSHYRRTHTATLLQSGKVFVAGRIPELFDPDSGAFAEVPASGLPGWPETSALLPDGSLHLIGSYLSYSWTATSLPVNPIFLSQYREDTGRIELIAGKYHRAGPYLQAMTVLTDGRVLTTGGCNDPYGFDATSDVEIYDPKSSSFRRLEHSMPARHSHQSTLLADGRVLITGGWDGSSLDDVALFDPTSESFVRLPAMQSARSYHTATLLPDGSVLIAGGVIGAPSAERIKLENAIAAPEIAVAPSGDFLEIYATGFQPQHSLRPFVFVDGRIAEIVYFGPASGLTGVQQINVQVPALARRGEAVPVQINHLGRPSNRVEVSISKLP